jgi:hypothetical protein
MIFVSFVEVLSNNFDELKVFFCLKFIFKYFWFSLFDLKIVPVRRIRTFLRPGPAINYLIIVRALLP